MIFYPKDIDVCFVILCLDGNSGLLKHTVKSLRFRYGDVPFIAIVERGTNKEEIEEMKKSCQVYRGKQTVTSLMNTGLRNTKHDWNMFVVAGIWVKGDEIKKMSRFIESDNDILYPVVNQMGDWEKASLNGILMHRNTFKKVGAFIDNDTPLEQCKLVWGAKAIENGCQLKSILGPKII